MKLMNQILNSSLHKQLIGFIRVNLSLGKTVFIVIYPLILLQFACATNAKRKEKTVFLFSIGISGDIIWNHRYLRTYQNQIHPNEQLSSYPVNQYSRKSYDSRNCSSSNLYSAIRSNALYQIEFQWIDRKVLVRDIVIVIGNSILVELHRVLDSLNFIANEDSPDLLNIHLSEIIVIVIFLNPTLKMDSVLEFTILHIVLHWDHVQDLPPHLEDLLILYNQIPLKIMTITMKTFQSRKKNVVNMYTNEKIKAITPTSWFYYPSKRNWFKINFITGNRFSTGYRCI